MNVRIQFCCLAAWAVMVFCPLSGAGEPRTCPDAYVPTSQAINQSNEFALGADICEPLQDGFQHAGFKCLIDAKGRIARNISCSTVFDRRQDEILRTTIADCRKHLDSLETRARAGALGEYVRSLLHPAGLNWQALTAWDDCFGSQHHGQRVLLGEYIAQHKGVCEQQAILFKALGDALGLSPTLHFGYQEGSAHVWNTISTAGEKLIYDPALGVFGINARQAAEYVTIPVLYGTSFKRLADLVIKLDSTPKDNPRERLAIQQEITRLDESALGTNHGDLAISYEYLSRAYRQAGMLAQSEKASRKAVAIAKQAHGERHPLTADQMNQLAMVCAAMGNKAQAALLFKRAAQIYADAYGPNHANVADATFNLAEQYRAQKRFREAERSYLRARDIYLKAGTGHAQDLADTDKALRLTRAEIKKSS